MVLGQSVPENRGPKVSGDDTDRHVKAGCAELDVVFPLYSTSIITIFVPVRVPLSVALTQPMLLPCQNSGAASWER